MANHTLPIIGTRSSSGQHHSALNDNNLETCWVDNRQDAWVEYDLGSVQPVNGVYVAFGNQSDAIYQYKVDVSQDRANWTEVHSGNSHKSGGADIIKFGKEDAQFVRLTVHENDSVNTNQKYNAMVAEFTVDYDPSGKASKKKDKGKGKGHDKSKTKSTKPKEKKTVKKTNTHKEEKTTKNWADSPQAFNKGEEATPAAFSSVTESVIAEEVLEEEEDAL